MCPECLMKMGLGIGTEATGAAPQSRRTFVPPTIAELGPRFPQFEILALIGHGGMGAVYKARQKQLERVVALKILPPGIGEDLGFADRFAREAKAMARLNHPGIVTIHDFGCADGLYYLVMEFVDGVSLGQLMSTGRVSPREALAIVPQICDALQCAHDQGIVHRDIKPENILLDRQGRVKVADFGLAKLVGTLDEPQPQGARADAAALTQAGKTMGTPSYMAPEQVGDPRGVDHRADIYALGIVFYQMLTGELPLAKFVAPSQKVRIDVRLDEVVLKALEKEPSRRYQHASKLKTDVETIAGQTTEGSAKSSPKQPAALPKLGSRGENSTGGFMGLNRAFATRDLDRQQWMRRGPGIERNIILPAKAALIIILFQSFYSWNRGRTAGLELPTDSGRLLFWIYVALTFGTSIPLLAVRRLPMRFVQVTILITCLVDGCLVAGLSLLTGGYMSPMFWIFIVMLVRGAVVEPRVAVQLLLNFTLIACYLAAGYLDSQIAHNMVTTTTQRLLELYATDDPGEPLLLRLTLLLVVTFCCSGVDLLLRRSHAQATRFPPPSVMHADK